ncbi:MAG: hypothetical protein J7L82_02110, partial [Staphylothermus sp.]|nr:hypothetical protein [Staphylothermus sp.]
AIIHIIEHVVRKAKPSLGEYLVANRNLGLLTGAITLTFATCSGWYALGSPAVMYTYGYIEVILFSLWCLGAVFMWYFLGKWMRDTAEKYGSYTIPETISAIHDRSNLARVALGLLTVLGGIAFAVGQLTALARVVHVFSGLSLPVAAIISAVIVMIYLGLKGYWGIVATSLAAAIIMFPGLVFEIIYAYLPYGGFTGLDAAVTEISPTHAIITGEPYGVGYLSLVSIAIAYGLWNLLPQNTMNIIALSKKVNLRRFAVVFGFMSLVLILHFWTGIVARIVIPDPGSMSAEDVVLESYKIVFPTWAALLIAAGIWNMALTTMDNISLAVGGCMIRDVVKPILEAVSPTKKLSEKTELLVTRLATILTIFIVLIWVITNVPPFIAFIGAVGSAALIGAYLPWIISRFYKGNAWGIVGSCIAGIIGMLVIWWGYFGWADGIVFAAVLSTIMYILFSKIASAIKK